MTMSHPAGGGSIILLELGQTSTAFTAVLIDELLSPSYDVRAVHSEGGSHINLT